VVAVGVAVVTHLLGLPLVMVEQVAVELVVLLVDSARQAQ
jgi:hypothetical protein